MISYDNPTCSVTNNRATFFCLQQGCNRPAFACEQSCLYEEGHFENGEMHKTMEWTDIEESVRLIMELPLSSDEQMLLEKQEKSLKIIIDELQTMWNNHQHAVRQSKRQLYAKGIAQKVLNAVRHKANNKITGNDMAKLIEVINTDHLFTNMNIVKDVISERNTSIDKALASLRVIIDQYMIAETSFTTPKDIPEFSKFTHVIPKVDTANSSKAVVDKNGIVTTKTDPKSFQDFSYYPVFGCDSLKDGQQFTVKVVDSAWKLFTVGLATADLRNQPNKFNHANSLCIDARSGKLYSTGNSKQHQFTIESNSQVTVQRGRLIKWLCNGHLLCSAPITYLLTDVPLFPVLWIYSGSSPKLRFV